MNEAFLFDYDHERVMKKTENSIREESYEKGLTKGIEEGSHQEKVEIAKNLLKMKMIPQDIANATGLSIEEIESIQK